MESKDGPGSELESFRRQWLSDLQSRNTASGSQPSRGQAALPPSNAQLDQLRTYGASRRAESKKPLRLDDDDGYVQRSFDGPPTPAASQEHGLSPAGDAGSGPREPVSALDYYEEAIEREAAGSLGDSLKLYRKAFRLDSRVDQLYRKKHFPLLAAKSTLAPTPLAPAAKPAAFTGDQEKPKSVTELISSFAGLAIAPAKPEIEGRPPPPCPLAGLPDEILVHILRDVAVADIGDMVRLSLVCKKLAFLVGEEQIWRRVCLGTEFGFGGMHFHWQQGISWEPLAEDSPSDSDELLSPADLALQRRSESLATTLLLLPLAYRTSWQRMFRHRPRIRFNGCYISTVNYIRAGQGSANQVTWNSPVHIVTYYRYLRFFRDGACLSLLTVAEPADVVHHLSRDTAQLHRAGANAHLPSAVVGHAHRGRWRLSSAADASESTAPGTGTGPGPGPADPEGDLYVETEGVGKYVYRLELSVRSAGRAARSNKLVWRGFYSYNPLTDDWGEFGLKNDKPFFFSRVKSYGTGE